jgi:hypothetical protein|tara:strand:- start:19887 stop:20276 length:390 start_codon:yes stop_codon:yes gene_type:complete
MSLFATKWKASKLLKSLQEDTLPFQVLHLERNGCYWIGCSVPVPPPSDGDFLPVDGEVSAPGLGSWSDAGITLSPALDFSVGVDTLCKSGNHSYRIVVEVNWAAATHVKTAVYDGEWNVSGWVQQGPFA